jgi:hypothetical protein
MRRANRRNDERWTMLVSPPIRLRKKLLDETDRKRADRAKEAETV